MRFFLDQNIDARLRKFFTARSHDCWTADEAGLADEADGQLTVYANDKDAVVVAHDREFSKIRRQHVVGRHVYLNCLELEASKVLETRFVDIMLLLERHADLFIVVSKDGMQVTYPNETWDA